jgi:hypothetical protein
VKFDYDGDQTNPDAVLTVADAIRAVTALKPVSDEDRALLDLEQSFRVEENRRWHEQRRLEREAAQAEEAEVAQRAAAIAAAQSGQKAREESRKRYAEQARERELSQLRLRATQHEAWQRGLERSANLAVHQQRTRAVLGELEAMINPPPPPPEPEVEVVSAGHEPDDGWPVLHRWFAR